MIETFTIQRNKCTCHCGHSWVSDDIPARCPSCKSRKWNTDDPFFEPQIKGDPKKVPETVPEVVKSKPPIPEKPPVPEKVQPKPQKATFCPTCFAMNGQHQKWCSKK